MRLANHWLTAAVCLTVSCLPVPATAAEKLPSPPQQSAAWQMPDGVADPDGAIKQVVEAVFRLGMADPRGCPFHHVIVRDDGKEYPARGWVLPTDDATKQRYAISWNGLIYPVEKVGKEADLHADLAEFGIARQCDPSAADPVVPEKRFDNYREECLAHVLTKDAWLPRIARDAPLPYLLLRLGIPIQLTVTAEGTRSESTLIPRPTFDWDTYFGADFRWLVEFAIFARNDGVAAFLAGNHALAAARLTLFDAVWQEVEKRLPVAKPNDDDPFAVARPTLAPTWRSVLADAARRLQPPPPPAASELARTIATWDQLDTWDEAAPPAAVIAVIAAGNTAIEPLLDCLEHDWRWTRASTGDEGYQKCLLRVKDIALFALERVLRFETVDRHPVPDQPTDDWYRQTAADFRAFCRNYGSACGGELWFRILADSDAPIERQWTAAELVVRGEDPIDPFGSPVITSPDVVLSLSCNPPHHREAMTLRAKKDPSVCDLLAKFWRRVRTDVEQTLKSGTPEGTPLVPSGGYGEVPRERANSAFRLVEEWEPGNKAMIREHFRWLADACEPLKRTNGDGLFVLSRFCEEALMRRFWCYDEQAMNDYRAFFRSSLSCSVVPIEVMSVMAEQPGMDALAQDAFLGDLAPLRLTGQPWRANDPRRNLVTRNSRLLILPAFRRALVEALGNTSKQATLIIGKGSATLTYEHATRDYPESLTPDATLRRDREGSTIEVRLCDLIAWHLTPKHGPAVWTAPSFHLDDPLPDRDRSIQQWIKTLTDPAEAEPARP